MRKQSIVVTGVAPPALDVRAAAAAAADGRTRSAVLREALDAGLAAVEARLEAGAPAPASASAEGADWHFHFRGSPAAADRVRRAAERSGASRSAVLREALDAGLAAVEARVAAGAPVAPGEAAVVRLEDPPRARALAAAAASGASCADVLAEAAAHGLAAVEARLDAGAPLPPSGPRLDVPELPPPDALASLLDAARDLARADAAVAVAAPPPEADRGPSPGAAGAAGAANDAELALRAVRAAARAAYAPAPA